MERRIVKPIKVGGVLLSGSSKIAIQSMLNTDSENIDACVEQTKKLKSAGCDIVRIAIPTMESVKTIYKIKETVDIPLVADIHFDYKLALESCEAGIDKIRINPGNIGSDDRVEAVAKKCGARNIPIRIGVNSGSVEKDILSKYGSPCPEALVESAFYHINLLRRYDFDDIVVSIKSSDVQNTIKSYRLIAEKCNYPLHIGVTEAGTKEMGIVKSSIGIGSLLCDGIGDTIRVSLTADPIEEIYAAKNILKAVGYSGFGPEIVSCPTCGRTKINLIDLAEKVNNAVKNIDKDIKIAVMGCVVNGPGEAKEADIGIAGGDNCAVLFKKGEIIKKIPQDIIVDCLIEEIEKL